jgi:ubiquinone/menaquinone biosynthesis C-methylase UbiE
MEFPNNPTVSMDFTSALRAYWEDPQTVSIIDKNLHQIESDTVCRHLLPTDSLADLGCGNGEATVRYAAKVARCIGIERSECLRHEAERRAKESGLSNISVRAGDVLSCGSAAEFDVIVSQRLLINLGTWEEQMGALSNIHRMLKPGGRFIMIENTNDAFVSLNNMRASVGLSPIPQHWHNRFFDYDELMEFFHGKFQLLHHYDFGLYYLLTRVYVPMFASFQGWGASAVKDSIFDQSDAAARILFDKFADRIKIGGYRALGPIQAFVLRREGSDIAFAGDL